MQINAAMQLAKAREEAAARDRRSASSTRSTDHPAVAKAEIAGPGFVNVFVRDEWLAAHADARADAVREVAAGAARGARLLVAQRRQADAHRPHPLDHHRRRHQARRCAPSATTVIADNHLGDWGTQFGKLIVAYRKLARRGRLRRRSRRRAAAPLHQVPGRGQERRRATTTRTTARRRRRSSPRRAPSWSSCSRATPRTSRCGRSSSTSRWPSSTASTARLGVAFDVVARRELLQRPAGRRPSSGCSSEGIAEESQGALVVFFKKPDGTDEMPPAHRAQGRRRLSTTPPPTSPACSTASSAGSRRASSSSPTSGSSCTSGSSSPSRAGSASTCSLEHVWFGLMRLPEGTISTREGKLIGLEALLDEAETRAFEVATQAQPRAVRGRAGARSRASSASARSSTTTCRKDRQTLVTFTWDKALSLDGQLGPVPAVRLRAHSVDPAQGGRRGRGAGRDRRRWQPTERALLDQAVRLRRRRRGGGGADAAAPACATTCTIWRAPSRRSTASTRC